MTGRSRSGKMSMRIRVTATTAVSATAITATRTVTGRRSAARTSHMPDSLRLTSEVHERPEVTPGNGNGQQRQPDVHARELILHFGRRQQALRVGDLDDAG